MYLSNLLIDLGADPDRPRPGRLWLRNIYHVHQRLCMAFPSTRQREEDPHFLRPFDPPSFDLPRFLFRIDKSIAADSPRAVILVQAERAPDWDYAFHNAGMFLAAPPETKEFDPAFQPGDVFRFRIRVNLSKKAGKSKDGTDLRKPREGKGADAQGRPRTQGKRIALTWEKDQEPDAVIREWFALKGARRGFDLGEFRVLDLGWVSGFKPKTKTQADGAGNGRSDYTMKFRSALLEGTLTVTDASIFSETVASGIGSAKAFGFGLLSVARVRAG